MNGVCMKTAQVLVRKKERGRIWLRPSPTAPLETKIPGALHPYIIRARYSRAFWAGFYGAMKKVHSRDGPFCPVASDTARHE